MHRSKGISISASIGAPTAAAHRGIVLSQDLAVEIYKWKLTMANELFRADEFKHRSQSAAVSRLFGVSPKTVRDIWNHVTWKKATCHVWPKQANEGEHPETGPSGSGTMNSAQVWLGHIRSEYPPPPP
jgi:hypothetical protein